MQSTTADILPILTPSSLEKRKKKMTPEVYKLKFDEKEKILEENTPQIDLNELFKDDKVIQAIEDITKIFHMIIPVGIVGLNFEYYFSSFLTLFDSSIKQALGSHESGKDIISKLFGIFSNKTSTIMMINKEEIACVSNSKFSSCVKKNEIPSIQEIYKQFILNENFHYYCKFLRDELKDVFGNIQKFLYKLYIIPKEKFQMEEYIFLRRKEKDRIEARIQLEKIVIKHKKIVEDAKNELEAIERKLSLKNYSNTMKKKLEREQRKANKSLNKALSERETAISNAGNNLYAKDENKGSDDWIGLRKTEAFKEFEKTFFKEGEKDMKYMELSSFEELSEFKEKFIGHSDIYKSKKYVELFEYSKYYNMEFRKNIGWQLWLEYPIKTFSQFCYFNFEINATEKSQFYQIVLMMNLLKKDSDITKFMKLIRNWDNPRLQELISSFDDPSDLTLIETAALNKSNNFDKFKIKKE